MEEKNWHQKHKDSLTMGEKIADGVAATMGSWRFIIIQSIFVGTWILFNSLSYFYHFDTFPYVLLNLLFSTQAAYAAPIIMMAQNRQSDRDRVQAESDYATNKKAEKEIEQLQLLLSRIENDKLDKILAILEKNG